jgi:hypothetical protein
MLNHTEILRNEHFNNLAAILRVSLTDHWRNEHPSVPVLKREDDLAKLVFAKNWPVDKAEVLDCLTGWLTGLVQADPELMWYTMEDLDWLLGVLDSDDAKTVLSLFMAWIRAETEYLTPAEIAERTGTAESGWRNKAAAQEIPGAVKKGKQWLLPEVVLRAKGILKAEK